MKPLFAVAVRVAACMTAAGCIEAPVAITRGGPEAFSPRLTAFDARGQPCELEQLPRRPDLELNVVALDPSGPGPLLFQGLPDAELLADLERLPLTAASMRRLVPTQVRHEHGRASIQLASTLASAAVYTLALTRTAFQDGVRDNVPTAWTQVLRTADGPNAGAAVSGTFPPDGSAGVAPALDFAVLTFDGSVEGVADGVWLEDSDGWAVPAEIASTQCDALDDSASACVRVTPFEALRPLSQYALRTGRELRDAHGAEVATVVATFTTRADDTPASLSWQVDHCALDETATPVGCALLSDEQLLLRIQLSAPARLRVHIGARQFTRLAGTRPLEVVQMGLAPNAAQPIRVQAETGDGASLDAQFVINTLPDLAKLSITEVLADPFGAEPDLEYVELVNFGEQAIALRGFTISDRPDEFGTRIERDISLAAGARALLVSDAFDAASSIDMPPAPGAVLVHVGAAVTRAGLANAGEALFLRDNAGHRLSAAPATPAPRAGTCNVRISSDLRTGAAGSFAYASDDSCSPGR